MSECVAFTFSASEEGLAVVLILLPAPSVLVGMPGTDGSVTSLVLLHDLPKVRRLNRRNAVTFLSKITLSIPNLN